MINRDPDSVPVISRELIEIAKQLDMKPVLIICDEPDAKVGDQTSISFWAMVEFLPRMGDRIVLENGRICEVKSAYFKVVTEHDVKGKATAIVLTPNVTARLLPGKQ